MTEATLMITITMVIHDCDGDDDIDKDDDDDVIIVKRIDNKNHQDGGGLNMIRTIMVDN